MALNKLTPTTKESGRGGLGGRGQSAPPGGIFKGGNAPLKWSFASFSSNKKRKGLGVLGARPERPLSPGPARSKKYPCWGFGGNPQQGEALCFKKSRLPGLGAKSWIGEVVALRIITSPRQGANFRLGEQKILPARDRRSERIKYVSYIL